MTQFLALMRLEFSQWKTSMNVSAGTKQKKDRKVSRALLLLFLVGIIGAYLIFFEIKAMDILQPLGNPQLLLKFLTFAGMLISLVFGLFQVISSLYFSRDIAIIGYLPVRDRQVYAARLCGQLLEEIAINAVFILPGTVIYMTRLGFSAALLLRALLITCLAPVLPLCVCALLAGILTKIPGFWRHRETITTAFTIVVLIAYIALCAGFGGMTGASVDDDGSFQAMIMGLMNTLDGATVSMPPVRWHAEGLAFGGLNLLWALLADGAVFALAVLLFGRNYIACASKGLETAVTGKKVDMKKLRLRSGSALTALTKREISEMVRTPAYLTNGLLMSLIMPSMMVGILLFSLSRSPEGIGGLLEALDPTGTMRVLIAAFMTAMMGMLLGMNSSAATSVSREGRRHPLFRSLPVETKTIVLSKLIMGLILQGIGLVPACLLIAFGVPGMAAYAPLVLLWSFLLSFIGTCAGLAVDLNKPKMDWLNEVQAMKSGINQVISLLIYMAMLGILAFASYLLIDKRIVPVESYGYALTGMLLIFCVLAWLWLNHNVKYYERIGE